MRRAILALILAGCAEEVGPPFAGKAWAVTAIVGDDLLAQGTCDLRFQVQGDEEEDLAWLSRCGRDDLPATIIGRGEVEGAGFLYEVGGGGESTAAQWLTRIGDHEGLFELWVYPSAAEVGPLNYNADYVALLWEAREAQ